MRDWFAYSAFACPELAQAVNRQLDAIFRSLHGRLSEQRANGSLYVTGSLARQEPSIDIRGPSARLRSDIDLVFATTEEEAANPCIASLEHWDRELWPDYDVSVVFVPLAGVHELRSCFARDLSLAVDAPLYRGAAGGAALPKRTATTTDYFESAIHQAASLLLFDDSDGARKWLYSRDRDYHRVRAALELLRCIVATETPVVRLCELREHANAVSLRRLVTPEEVVVAIRARELFDGTGTSLDVLDLLRAAASICIVDGTPDRGYYDVVTALEAALPTDQVIPGFQRAFLAYAMGLGARAPRETIPLVRRIIGALSVDAVTAWPESRKAGRDRERRWSSDRCALQLRLLRENYLAALHRRNLGWELPTRPRVHS